ncbi:disease resistance protein RPV1 [Trifolium repens]|nr:disease resistance protein RPV1 [Trifolium repens]
MHDLLQELGKQIVRQQFPDEPGSWSRLWLYEDIYTVMTTETGTNKVKAIILDQKQHISEYPPLLADGLKSQFLPNNLQYLLWDGYPFASLPLNFEPLRLVELNMPCSLIQRLWDGHKDLPCLKRVDLSNSKCLVETPNFAGSRRLERLDLTGCINLSSGLYIFNCPLLNVTEEGPNLALWWLKRLIENPCHFRCGFDIVVPGFIFPMWFHYQFTGYSRVRIADSECEYDNWIGFIFCVAFVGNCGSTSFGSSQYSFSSQLPHPLYLSFESEHMEETFDIPLRLDLNKGDGSIAEHLW